MEYILFLPILISFITCLIFLPMWIRKSREVGLLWEDMNKHNHPKNVASSGGLIVVISFIIGVLFYVAFRTFFRVGVEINLQIFALTSTILLFAIIGLTDDLLGWNNGGLSKRLRVVLSFVAAIPLIVIHAGESIMFVPILGQVEFGLLFPLFLVPLGIAGAATTYNFLAGFNGLEAGQGIIILSFLSYVAYATGSPWLSLIGMVMVASLVPFFIFNKVPAKVFPGDILTYSVGGLIAIMAILGNFEKIAIFVFAPYILETALKVRGGLKKHSFGKPNKDNSLELPYKKIYGMTHLSIFILSKFKKKVYEKDVTYFIFLIQIILCLVALAIFM
jgi:UDP-N-acetylglucosamine--dolichyl-phosphate N-acetylglucosaminephosphotransferase